MKHIHLKNEDGFAIVACMLVLVVLTIIGIAATNTTSIEVSIAANEKIYKQNFYQAEGAARQASEENPQDDFVFVPGKGEVIPLDGSDPDISAICTQSAGGMSSNTTYGVVDNGIPTGVAGAGESLKVEGTGSGGRAHFLDLYGRSTDNDTSVNIIMGFATRF